jgi:hypothetical protein
LIVAKRRIIGAALGSIIAVIITIHMTSITRKVARVHGMGIMTSPMAMFMAGSTPAPRRMWVQARATMPASAPATTARSRR